MYGIRGRRREEKEGESEALSSYAVYPAGSLINQAPPAPTRNQCLVHGAYTAQYLYVVNQGVL
jgi:hypothetical protein